MGDSIYKLSPKARLILYYLTDHGTLIPDGNGAKEIFVKKKVLAAHAHSTMRTVARLLRRLEALGYITTETRLTEDGDHDASRYVVRPMTAEFAQELLERHLSKDLITVSPLPVVPPGKQR